MATKLTHLKVEKAKPHPTKRREIYDAGRPGLILIVQPSGKKSWAIRYRRHSDRKACKLTLPGFPSLATARKLATAALDRVAEGHDPATEKQTKRLEAQRRQADTIDAAFKIFLDEHVRTRKGRPIKATSRRETARLLGLRRDPNNLIDGWSPTGNGVMKHWRGRALHSITKADVRSLTGSLATRSPISANRTLAAMRTCFGFHVRRGTIAISPCDGVDYPAPESGGRDRVLSDLELAAVWHAAASYGFPYGAMVQLLVLTGCRRDEVREMRWEEIDLVTGTWNIPGERTKNSRPHVVPITDPLRHVLAGLPRIVGRSGTASLLFTTGGDVAITDLSMHKRKLDALVAKELGQPIKPWVLHDLRRGVATGLQKMGIRIEVTEAILNHKSGTIFGVAAIYARHDHAPEKRAALDQWSQHVMSLVKTPSSDKVVQLRRKK
jgi:integrase